MRIAQVFLYALVFVASAGFANAPGSSAAAAGADTPLFSDSDARCATELRADVLFAATGCTASLDCGSGITVSCQGNLTCSTWPRECTEDQPGFVRCDGVQTSCPNACDCNSLAGAAKYCCYCARSNDCIACCRCQGFSLSQCATRCNG